MYTRTRSAPLTSKAQSRSSPRPTGSPPVTVESTCSWYRGAGRCCEQRLVRVLRGAAAPAVRGDVGIVDTRGIRILERPHLAAIELVVHEVFAITDEIEVRGDLRVGT